MTAFYAIEDKDGRISPSDVYKDRPRAQAALASLARVWPMCRRFNGGAVVEITAADARVMAEADGGFLMDADTRAAIMEAEE